MKYIFYLLPGLLNVVISLFHFITTKRMADSGATSLLVTATIPTWALTYTAASFFIGRFATRSNAVKITLISQIILLISMAGLIFSSSVNMQFLWLTGSGIGTGLFFVPFQAVVKLFEKKEIALETFARSTAIYTVSWSSGQAIGPIIAALLWGYFDPQNGWKYCYLLNMAIVLLVIISLFFMQVFIRKRINEENHLALSACDAEGKQLNSAATAANTVSESTLPDVMRSAWLLALGGYLALAVIRSYLPDYATKTLQLPTSAQGMMLGILSVLQVTAAACFIKTRYWPYRPYIGTAGCICAVMSFILILQVDHAQGIWLATGLFGIFSGIFCYNLTYHALANAAKSARYASINETIVGATSILAPLGAGFLADCAGAAMPFYCLIAILLATAFIYSCMLWRYRNTGR